MAADNPMQVRGLLESLVQTQIILTDSPPDVREPNTLYFDRNIPVIERVRSLFKNHLVYYHADHHQTVDQVTLDKETDDLMRYVYGSDYGRQLEPEHIKEETLTADVVPVKA